jgi:FkbM family methyltransferase
MKRLKLAIGDVCVNIIRFLSRKAKIDLISLGYLENGLTQSQTFTSSGEEHFISTFLPQNLKNPSPIFFDVGANKGEYTKLLRKHFNTSEIHSFEPNPVTFDLLKGNCSDEKELNNLGLGKERSVLELFFDANNESSVQATSNKEILEVIAKTENINSVQVNVITLDLYCTEKGISSIDLLKIDTEGFELEVLEGAKDLLEKGKIKMIQFEFNEVNIIKRVFLRDFFEILADFDFFRLDRKRLIPLKEWSPRYEIFLFQNIVAIKK